MNLSKFLTRILLLLIATASAKLAMAQNCTSTTQISTSTTSTFSFTGSNQCLAITIPGSITVGNSATAISNPFSGYSNLGINNAGVITVGAASAYGIYSGSGTIASLINSGTIISNTTGYGYGIVNYGNITTLDNSGTISTKHMAISHNNGTIANFNNSGTINGDFNGIRSTGTITTLTNSGEISGGDDGIYNSGVISNFINSKFGSIVVNGNNFAINNDSGSLIGSLINLGTISRQFPATGAIQNLGEITAFTNAGSIAGTLYNNYSGAITTLNNLQGGLSPLALDGNLPSNYNIIINSPTNFGKLQVYGTSGTTTFGIYAGGVNGVAASTVSRGTYAGVLAGINPSDFSGPTTGNYKGFSWALSETNLINGIWDLIVTGASTADTQQSLVNTVSALQNTYALQNSVLANSLSYDCSVFGVNNICVSAGGRNTAVSAANGLNNTSGLLIAAYQAHPRARIGAYVDQNLSVNNAGSTVRLSNNTPLLGLFGAWNESLDDTGTEVKASAAYGQKNTTVTRSVVGASEAGSGSSQLNSQGAQVTAKYGVRIAKNTIISPYAGLRYTQNNMGGYTENISSSVTTPLTYSALNTNATTALAGVGASYHFIPQVMLFASAGVESDTNTSNGTYSATGVAGLTPISFNSNPAKTRPTATLGAYYDIVRNQRVGVTGIYRQEPYQAVSSTTVMATFTIGL
jgi:hypothetical protein